MAQQAGTATTGRGWRQGWRRLVDGWVRRRAPIHPPLTLSYRQIFILPTRFGWMLGLLMSAMLIGSLNFNNNLGLLTTFIVAGVAIHAMLLAYRNLHGISIRGGTARPVFAGQPALYRVNLADADGRPRLALRLIEEQYAVAFHVLPHSTGEAVLALPTRRRGWMLPGRIQLETTWPVGLFRAWSWFWPARPILVWPRPATHPPPLPETGTDELGQVPSTDIEGEEFYSLRGWREGDPLHRIAWKASQRHQDLLSREFRREQSPNLVLDINRAPGKDLEERISVLTAWLLMADRGGRSWSLILHGRVTGPASGPAHLEDCLRQLAEL